MKKKKLLVITPIQHIDGLHSFLKKNFIVDIISDPKESHLIKIISKYNSIFTNPNMSKVFISKKILKKAKLLESICTASTGTNHIDLDFAKKNRIKIISLRNNLKIINQISSTAEHALSLMLSAVRNIIPSSESVKKNLWDYRPFVGRQLNQLTIGVIGYGRLGKMFTKFLTPIVKNIYVFEKNFQIRLKSKKVISSNLEKLLQKSDVISLHIHADQDNIEFINKNKLMKMKKNVILINTSRGEIINENDLVQFLKKNKEAKYYTDVISDELRNKYKSKIFKYNKKSNQIIITPHIGGMTIDAQKIAYFGAAKKLIKFSY